MKNKFDIDFGTDPRTTIFNINNLMFCTIGALITLVLILCFFVYKDFKRTYDVIDTLAKMETTAAVENEIFDNYLTDWSELSDCGWANWYDAMDFDCISYKWEPKKDITIYELSLILPVFTKDSAGMIKVLPWEAKRHFILQYITQKDHGDFKYEIDIKR